MSSFNFKFQVSILSFNFKFQFQVSISKFNIKFQVQVLISNFDFKFQFHVSVSCFSFKFKFQVSIKIRFMIKFLFKLNFFGFVEAPVGVFSFSMTFLLLMYSMHPRYQLIKMFWGDLTFLCSVCLLQEHGMMLKCCQKLYDDYGFMVFDRNNSQTNLTSISQNSLISFYSKSQLFWHIMALKQKFV